MARNVVANVMDQFRADLEPHILRDISEVSVDICHPSSGFRVGSDASVIELNWHGTYCVGKVLHSVFFQDSEPSGMQHILTKFCKEISLLKELKHPNIVQFLGLYYRQSSPIPIMVMEKMECNLTELLDTYKIGSIPEYKAYGILNDVIKGLVYLHEVKEVAHRDLSSNNILVTSYLCAKIADLGSARVLNKPGGWNKSMQLTIQPGTQDFMPPEALEDPPRYGLSVDVFSFGCVIIHLITHQWPRPVGQTSRGKIISENERRQKFIERMGFNHPLFSVVERCLHDDANGRPSSKQILELLESIANKQQLEYRRTQLQDFITGLQYNYEMIEEQKRKILLDEVALKKKNSAIKGLQEILRKEQQSHEEMLAMLEDHNAKNQQEIDKLKQLNEELHTKVGELSKKCEQAETEYGDLQSHEELQKYKEKVISLEHDIRKSKQVEADLYKELDEALKDLVNISNRYRSLQNENSELRRGQSMPTFSGTDDPQLVQELIHKNKQVEVMHGQLKQYADSLDREKRKISMLTMENLNYQQQLQQFQTVPPFPPRSPVHHNKAQPVPNTHRGWEGQMQSSPMVLSRDTGSNQLKPEQHMIEPRFYSEGRYNQYDTNAGRSAYRQFNMPNSHPPDRSRTTPHFGDTEPCPLCGQRFATTEQLTIHAASCSS